MKRIKENEIKMILKKFNHRNINIQINGVFQQKCLLENAEILLKNNGTELEIKDQKNKFVFKLSYIEEIYFLQKNKLKFLTDKEIEILIIFSF